jgi:hypothetical protein
MDMLAKMLGMPVAAAGEERKDDEGFNLLRPLDKEETKSLSKLPFDFAVDTSFSTDGYILGAEIMFCLLLAEIIQIGKKISWNNVAFQVPDFNSLVSKGWTVPSEAILLLLGSKAIVFLTDGEIGEDEMKALEKATQEHLNDIPIIVVFAIRYFEDTIEKMQKTVNMSIPESFLKLSSNVLILITNGPQHTVLMAKGCFGKFQTMDVKNDTVIDEMPPFDLAQLREVMVQMGIPDGNIPLRNFPDHTLDTAELYKLQSASEIPIDILRAMLKDARMILPKLDLDKMHFLLSNIHKKVEHDPKLVEVKEQLANITKEKRGSPEHLHLIELYKTMKKTMMGNDVNKEHRRIASEFLAIIADYRSNKSDIVLGSNRADRAAALYDEEPDISDGAKRKCPILMDRDILCLMIKILENPNCVQEATDDFAMNAPFRFGKELCDYITPGFVGAEFVGDGLDKNPFTRQKLVGCIPLSYEPKVIMYHMSKIFGGGKQMWHLVQVFISMLAHICEKEWIDSDIIIPYLRKLVSNCKTYKTLREEGVGSQTVSLEEAFKYVVTEYAFCLRNRAPDDTRMIVKMVELLYPDFKFNKVKILGMANVIQQFEKILYLYKQNKDMLPFVMDVDDYGHYIRFRGGVEGLVAQMFWRDDGNRYKFLKLQDAIDLALRDSKYGESLSLAFDGEEFDESILELAIPEPDLTNPHFNPATELSNVLPEVQCIYCKRVFASGEEKIRHLRKEKGEHFYNGTLAVNQAIAELGAGSGEKELFMRTKEILLKKYRHSDGKLHTQRCKDVLLQMIRNIQ